MAGKDTITLKVDVDAKGAASGLKPLNTALDQTRKTADQTEAELGKIGGDVGKIKINDDAIDAARKEIARLRRQIREDLSLDVDVDTSASLKRISQLKRTIKSLDDEKVEIQAEVTGGGDIEHLAGSAAAAAPGFGRLAQNLSATKLAVGGTIAGIATAALTLGHLAGDAESARGQLDTLTGSTAAGAKAFEDLNRFAAQTPYEFEDVGDAARQLLAAGVDTKDLNANLLALGDAASAVNADLGEVALAYSQMVSKGKVSNEEMLQLQERGIDAYGTLAKRMGLTVAEVQKLASESKLGRDAVDELRKGMEETYGGSMQRQAATLNGKLSTLGDTTKALGTNIGNSLLPMFKDLVDIGLEVGGMLDTLMDKQAEWSKAAKEDNASVADIIKGELVKNTGDLFEQYKKTGISAGQWMDLFKHGDFGFSEKQKRNAELTAIATGKIKEEQKKAARETAKQAEAAQKAQQAAEAHEKAVKDANDELARMAGLYADIGGSIRTKVSFIFSQADLDAELKKLTHGKDAIELPAHLRLTDLGGLGDKQQQIVETISGSVEAGLQEGARRAELNPNFDEVAWYNQVRRKTKGQLIEAGIDTKDINRVLTNVFGLPRTIPVGANLDPAQQAVNDFKPTPKTLPVKVDILRPAANKPKVLPFMDEGGSLPATPAPITPKVDPAAEKSANTQLAAVAAPAGKARPAKITAKIDRASLASVDAKLDRLTADRHMTIFVHTQKAPGGGAAGTGALAGVVGLAAPSPSTSSGLVAAGRALTAPTATGALSVTGYAPGAQGAAGASPRARPAPVQMHPRETPVAVYLDGAVIADRLELRRSLAAVESVRRTA